MRAAPGWYAERVRAALAGLVGLSLVVACPAPAPGDADAGLDACALDHGGCDPNASCANTSGSRECRCLPGFCGDGLTCVEASECAPPAPPTELSATPQPGAARLSWTAEPRATEYEVKRAAASGGPYTLVGTTTAAAFLDLPLTNDTTVFYVVASVRNELTGPDSSEVAVTPTTIPEPPTGLGAIPLDRAARLSWAAASRATSYRVHRAPAIAGPYVDAGTTAETTFTDPGLVNGNRYFYAVSAIGTVGESAPSDAALAIPIAAPTGLSAVASDAQVALFWNPSMGATSYAIERATSPGGPYAALATTTGTRHVDGGLANGTHFSYRVVASNEAGPSVPSSAIQATPAPDADPLPPPDDPTRNELGMNVWFNADWDGAGAFVDAMKSSRPWQDAADWHAPVGGVDALGWPTADASTVIYSGEPAGFNGTYRLVFEGQATVSTMWCPGTVANQRYDSATNTTTADVTFSMTQTGSVGLVFRSTRRTANGVVNSGFSNVRLYRPGYPSDGSVVFTAPFLAALGRARVVRMMEWTGGSSNVVQHWADRVTPAHATQGGLPAPAYASPDGTVWTSPLGVAIEHQLQLCNALLSDCWLNVPPVADDEYVHKLALAVRFGTDGREPYASPQAHPVHPPLHPSLRLYLEYSNETWNSGGGFSAIHLIQAICAHMDAAHPVMTPAPASIWNAVWRYPAWRLAVISELFRSVFGDRAMMTRVRPVLMTQQGNAQNTLGEAITWLDGHLARRPGSPAMNTVVYGAGGSAYYGVTDMLSALPDRFFAPGNYPAPDYVRAFAIDALWSGAYGLHHVAYEGGPGLSFSAGDNRAINADPRMQQLVETMHDTWTGVGGGLLTYYTLRGPSEWEFTPGLPDAATPKLRALEALGSRPRAPVTIGGALPGSIVARTVPAIRTGYGYDLTIDGEPCAAGFLAPNMLSLPGHATGAYSGSFRLKGYTGGGARVGVWINGVRQGEVSVPARAGDWHLDDSAPLPVQVPDGLVVVRLEVLSGNLTIHSVSL